MTNHHQIKSEILQFIAELKSVQLATLSAVGRPERGHGVSRLVRPAVLPDIGSTRLNQQLSCHGRISRSQPVQQL